MNVHPLTGLHYYHVVPQVRGPFMDVWNVQSYVASKLPYVSCISTREFAVAQRSPLYKERSACFIVWDGPVAPSNGGARLIGMYFEAIGEADEMLPSHISHLYKYAESHAHYDLIFTHTPWMAQHLREKYGWKTAVLPLGYAPTMGAPNPEQVPTLDTCFWGSMVGKRLWTVPAFERVFGDRMTNYSGQYGTEITKLLNGCKTALYLAHSDVRSFSTWRAWQTLASNAVLVAEQGTHGWDAWPFVGGKDFFGMALLTERNVEMTVAAVARVIAGVDFDMHRKNREHLRTDFDAVKVFEDYVVPATKEFAP